MSSNGEKRGEHSNSAAPDVYARAALAYQRTGWGTPLPLPPRRKSSVPAGYTGRNGAWPANHDIETWAAQQPGGNIAVRLLPGVAGIDVDAWKSPEAAESWRALETRLGTLPAAPRSTSRDDGVSGIRLFRVPENWEAVGTLPGGCGEIIQWFHRYVVAWPSVHPDTGREYKWADGHIPAYGDLPELPAPWLAALGSAQPAQPAQPGPLFRQPGHANGRLHSPGWTDPDINALAASGIPGGHSQDDTLRDVVARMTGLGHSRHDTEATWWAIVSKTPQTKPQPWTQADFERHYAGAARKYGTPARHSQPGSETPAGVSRLDELRSQLLDSASLDQLPDPEPVIDGIIYRDTLVWLHGKPGHGKSFVALDWAGCISTGLPWQNHSVTPGPVFYVIAEGVSGLRQRVRAWEDHAATPMGVKFLPVAVQLLNPADVQAVNMLCGEMKPALVVFDTQARVTVGADENSARDMGELVAAADRIRRATRACVLLVHHEARNGENLRGSTALEGAAATQVRVTKDGAMITVDNPKQKDAPEFDSIRLWLTPRLESVVLSGSEPVGLTREYTSSEQKILDTLRDSFGTTGTPGSKLSDAAGVPKTSYYRALNRLVSIGAVINTGTAKRTWYQLPGTPEVPQSHSVPLSPTEVPESSPTSHHPFRGGTSGTGTPAEPSRTPPANADSATAGTGFGPHPHCTDCEEMSGE